MEIIFAEAFDAITNEIKNGSNENGNIVNSLIKLRRIACSNQDLFRQSKLHPLLLDLFMLKCLAVESDRLLEMDQKIAALCLQCLSNSITGHASNQRHLLMDCIVDKQLDTELINIITITSANVTDIYLILLYNCLWNNYQLLEEILVRSPRILVGSLALTRCREDLQNLDLLSRLAYQITSARTSTGLSHPAITSEFWDSHILWLNDDFCVLFLQYLDAFVDRLVLGESDRDNHVADSIPICPRVYQDKLLPILARFYDRFENGTNLELQSVDVELAFIALHLLTNLAILDASNIQQGREHYRSPELLMLALNILNSVDRLVPRLRANKDFQQDGKGRLDGMKVRLMKLVSYLLYRHPSNQDLVRTRDRIPLLLNQLNYDDQNPYIREWSVVAVRNLCESNHLNQMEIDSLKPQSKPELRL